MSQAAPSILVVEDDVDARNLLGRLLSSEGYSVRLAPGGVEGLLAIEEPVDLILLDMMMPQMDGPDFLRHLRAHRNGRDVPVVILSALDRQDVEPRVAPFGVAAILTKGGNLYPELITVIRRILASPGPVPRAIEAGAGGMLQPFLDVYLKMLAWA